MHSSPGPVKPFLFHFQKMLTDSFPYTCLTAFQVIQPSFCLLKIPALPTHSSSNLWSIEHKKKTPLYPRNTNSLFQFSIKRQPPTTAEGNHEGTHVNLATQRGQNVAHHADHLLVLVGAIRQPGSLPDGDDVRLQQSVRRRERERTGQVDERPRTWAPISRGGS